MKYIKTVLAVWGVISLAGAIFLLVAFFYKLNHHPYSYEADTSDVSFIFNWSGLEKPTFEVIHSYKDKRHFSDFIEYHCLELKEPIHLPSKSITMGNGVEKMWYYGEENELYAEARKGAGRIGKIEKCFENGIDGNHISISAFVWTMSIFQRYVSGAEIIFYHEPSNRILYVGYQT